MSASTRNLASEEYTPHPAMAESLSIMIQKEKTIYRSRYYLHSSLAAEDDACITESDRTTMVDWCYSIVDKLELDRETVARTMEMVDRFLSAPGRVARRALRDRCQFQLVALTALYVSIKTSEREVLGSAFFADLSRDLYGADEIEAMELRMLQGLSWRVCAPTSVQVARRILSMTLPCAALDDEARAFIVEEVGFQTECAVRDYYFVTQRPSTVALAAILNALDQVNYRDRRLILRNLLFVMKEEFPSIEDLLVAKSRLQHLVKDSDYPNEDVTVVSETSISQAQDSDYDEEIR